MQPNTLADLWTAEIVKLSFPWICDISHKVSFPSRSSNCFCLLSFAFDTTKKVKHLWQLIWKHLLASNPIHWGTAETFSIFFSIVGPRLSTGTLLSGDFDVHFKWDWNQPTEGIDTQGHLSHKAWETRPDRFPKPFLWFNTPCGYLLCILGERLILQLDIASLM